MRINYCPEHGNENPWIAYYCTFSEKFLMRELGDCIGIMKII